MSSRTPVLILALMIALTALAACSKPVKGPASETPPAQTPPAQARTSQDGPACPPAPAIPTPAPTPDAVPQGAAREGASPCLECEAVPADEDRGDCFRLQPGKTVTNAKGRKVTGRCQPQCIPYARCRSGFMSCRLGDTSPVQWFECARKAGDTSSVPKAGSLMVIGVEKRHNMSTGHLGYVEEACPNADGTWTLRFSHTNYDRKCHLDLDARVVFNPKTMRAAFLSGPWKTWARDLMILGFILK